MCFQQDVACLHSVRLLARCFTCQLCSHEGPLCPQDCACPTKLPVALAPWSICPVEAWICIDHSESPRCKTGRYSDTVYFNSLISCMHVCCVLSYLSPLIMLYQDEDARDRPKWAVCCSAEDSLSGCPRMASRPSGLNTSWKPNTFVVIPTAEVHADSEAVEPEASH